MLNPTCTCKSWNFVKGEPLEQHSLFLPFLPSKGGTIQGYSIAKIQQEQRQQNKFFSSWENGWSDKNSRYSGNVSEDNSF